MMGRQTVPDPAGEYCVETGTGSIIKVERDPAKRNAQVFIRADHLERPIRGWLDTHDLDLLGRLERAQTELGGRVAYRIDVRRTDKVAADLPWSEVGQTDRFRRLVNLADEHHLADVLPKPIMATVGAPAESSTPSPAGPGAQPAPAPAAPTSQPSPPPQADAAPRCPVCGESTAGRPVKRTPRGYVHTDTDCLTRPFDGDGFEPDTAPGEPEATVTGQAPPAGDPGGGIGVLAAGLAATAQRQDHYRAHGANGTDPDPHAASGAAGYTDPIDEAAKAGPAWACPVCEVHTTEDRTAHEASPVHQGKARQAEQAAQLRTQREAAEARRAAEHPDPARFDAGAAEVTKPPRIPIPTARGNGPRVAEGKPWEKFNTDGSLNMGSYGLTASIGMVELAQRLAIARLRAIAGDTGEQQHLDLGQVRALAGYLLEAADRVQAAVRDDGRYDRMDNSHTRARGAVRMALDVYPVPWGADPEVRARWVEDLAAYAAQLIRIAVDLDR